MADKPFDPTAIFNHIIGNFISGAFVRDDKGQITDVNPVIKKKLKPGFRAWTSADETVMGEIVRQLDSSGEINVWRGWLKKLKKHQRRQLRIHAVNLYNEFDIKSALGVIRGYLNLQEDDDDSAKTDLLLENDIITEDDPVEKAKDFVKKEYTDTRDSLQEASDDLENINAGLLSYLSRIKR
ncbi:MAG: hypothetical protein ABIJ91_02985 [Candidatus Kuenenbacteria bacterium]